MAWLGGAAVTIVLGVLVGIAAFLGFVYWYWNQ